VNIN